MLYVFQVDTGTMLTFDMNLAMESVSSLQEVIARVCRIPQDKQVLLISGGENLDPHTRVCSYAAGTDSNPIFLFSTSSIEAAAPPSASVNYGSEADLKDQVEGSLNMPPTYETVVSRAQLALQFDETGREELRICERLVHDQHLQHQGWGAVIANLEDITSDFQARWKAFSIKLDEYLSSRQEHMQTLSSFTDDLHLLSRIPVLPCLLYMAAGQRSAGSEGGGSRSEDESRSAESSRSTSETRDDKHLQPKTLLDWISAQDSRMTLKQLAEQCHMSLQQFDEEVQRSLVSEVKTVLEAVNNTSMKEVKGLEDRLCGLEQLMCGARKIVFEQAEMAQGFVQNQKRARNLADASVLPDLSDSHKRQLVSMLRKHQSVRDIRRRCSCAKEELSVNLHTRLRWVMYVQKTICDVHGRLVVHHDTLRKLRRQLHIVTQVHSAPWLYARALQEVVRRRRFSERFLQWAGELSTQGSELHQREVGKRKDFAKHLKNHFLQQLFPGFSGMPPPFAVQKPSEFDEHLPGVKAADLSHLQEQVPELAQYLQLRDSDSLSRLGAPAGADGCAGPGCVDAAPLLPPGGRSPTTDDTDKSSRSADADGDGDGSSESGDFEQSVEILDPDCDLENLSEGCGGVAPTPPRLGWLGARSMADLGESDVFTTADFFIDESVPPPLLAGGGGWGEWGREAARGVAEVRAGLGAVRRAAEQQRAAVADVVADTVHRIEVVVDERARHQAAALAAAAERADALQRRLDDGEERWGATCDEARRLDARLVDATQERARDADVARERLDAVAAELSDALERASAVETLTADVARVTDRAESAERDAAERIAEARRDERESAERDAADRIAEARQDERESAERDAADRISEARRDERESAERDAADRIAEARLAERDSVERDREQLEASHHRALAECAAAARAESELREAAARGQHEVAMADLVVRHALELARVEVVEARQDVECQATDGWTDEQTRFIEQAVSKERRCQEEKYSERVATLTTQQEKSLDELRTKLVAEKQVVFNEALAKVVEEKDKVIEQLRERERELLHEKDRDHGTISDLINQIRHRRAEGSDETRMIQRRLEEDLATAKQRILRYESETRQMTCQMTQSLTAPPCASHATLSSPMAQSQTSASTQATSHMTQSVVMATEPTDVTAIDASVGTSSRPQDKVSIITCAIGDTVLLCLDEKRDHYMVFNVGPTLHFLHSECLSRLGLKTNPGESRRSWVLAEVIDMDYCQAKKSPNRFKVPIATKFYRVKAAPWSRQQAPVRARDTAVWQQSTAQPTTEHSAPQHPIEQSTNSAQSSTEHPTQYSTEHQTEQPLQLTTQQQPAEQPPTQHPAAEPVQQQPEAETERQKDDSASATS